MTSVFQLTTSAGPDRVWVALTDAAVTGRYLNGLAAVSSWRTGAPVAFQTADSDYGLSGEVLVAQAPRRLSYTIGAGPGQPSTYVTWEVWAEGSGAAVRLYVDEPDAPMAGGTDPDAEASWSEIVARLTAVLAAPATQPATGTTGR